MPRELFKLRHTVQMLAGTEDTAEVMLYGQIINNMPDNWKWDEEDKSASDFNKSIQEIRKSGATKLLLRINSPGGVCTESVAMRSILSSANFDEITILIEGLCASAATNIATLPNAHVKIAEGSEYMIHNPWLVTYGNANEIEHVIERLRGIESMTRSFYVAKTGQSEERIKEWMDAETWFTAEEAVKCGFADELVKADELAGTEAVACVSANEMDVMRSLYKAVPQNIATKKPEKQPKETNNVSNENPVAGGSTENKSLKEENPMELSNLTMDQLRDGNPALLNEIKQAAVVEERARLNEIDALTDQGYEEMAAQAKADGTSAMDFYKQVIAARAKKGAEFMQQRQQETAPAQAVAGGEPSDPIRTEEQEIEANAKAIANFAESFGRPGEGMF
ncbi:MAG: Clp protease ClpP [Lachnospiraceae bacterium]|nr:Clp protease ClpP [Lachnospiraceae bacterium]